MAVSTEVVTFFVNGLEMGEDSYLVEVTDVHYLKKWISDDLKIGSSIRFTACPSSQVWELERDNDLALWSFHIKSGSDKLYVSYDDKGHLTMQPPNQGGQKSTKQEYERFFKMFLDDNGGVILTSCDSDKNILCIQDGFLAMIDGDKKPEVLEMAWKPVKRREVDPCSSGYGESCQGSSGKDRPYIVEIDDPDISGMKWNTFDPISGNVVELSDRDSQYWTVRISNSDTWTFQPRFNMSYYASNDDGYVKFEPASNQRRQFNVHRNPKRLGEYIKALSNPQEFVGKRQVGKRIILQMVEEHLAVGWKFNVSHIVFSSRDEPSEEIIFPDFHVLPAQ